MHDFIDILRRFGILSQHLLSQDFKRYLPLPTPLDVGKRRHVQNLPMFLFCFISLAWLKRSGLSVTRKNTVCSSLPNARVAGAWAGFWRTTSVHGPGANDRSRKCRFDAANAVPGNSGFLAKRPTATARRRRLSGDRSRSRPDRDQLRFAEAL